MRNRTFFNPSQSEHSDGSSKNDRDFECDICDFNTELKTDLRVHKEKKHYWCVMCDKTLESRKKLKSHKSVEHSGIYKTTWDLF